MIILAIRVNVQCCGKDLISLQPSTFLVALQSLLKIAFAVLRSVAFRFLLDPLAFASNQNLVCAWLLFLARHGKMTLSHTWVTTCTQLLATSLCTRLFTLSWAMALLPATMQAATQLLPTDLGASHLVQMARLVLESVLSTKAVFGGKK